MRDPCASSLYPDRFFILFFPRDELHLSCVQGDTLRCIEVRTFEVIFRQEKKNNRRVLHTTVRYLWYVIRTYRVQRFRHFQQSNSYATPGTFVYEWRNTLRHKIFDTSITIYVNGQYYEYLAFNERDQYATYRKRPTKLNYVTRIE